MQHPRLWLGTALSSFLALGACADGASSGNDGPGVRVAVAPLQLPGIGNACYGVTVTTQPFGAGEVVWSRTAATNNSLCADRFGDGIGSISYVGPCDAQSLTDHGIRLVLEELYDENNQLMTAGVDYQNPCTAAQPCDLQVACEENADTPVTFNLTIMRPAKQGFFDIAVNFEDIFCSAKVDCTYDAEGTRPIRLLHDPDTKERHRTVVFGFACTAGPGQDTWLYMSHFDVHCDSPDGTVVFALDPTDGPGNVSASQSGSAPPVPNDLFFEAAVYEGRESLSSGGTDLGKRYWNLALGIYNPEMTGGPALGVDGNLTNCEAHVHATAHNGAMNQPFINGNGVTPDGTYPFLHLFDLPLNTTGDLTCTRHGLDESDELYSDYTSPGAPWAFDHVLRPVVDGNGNTIDVVTEHVNRDFDSFGPNGTPRGSLKGNRKLHQNSTLSTVVGSEDLVDWFYFVNPMTAVDLEFDLKITPNTLNVLNPARLGYEVYKYPDFATVIFSGDNLSSPDVLLGAGAGRYYVRVFVQDPSITGVLYRYHAQVQPD